MHLQPTRRNKTLCLVAALFGCLAAPVRAQVSDNDILDRYSDSHGIVRPGCSAVDFGR